MKGTDAGRAPSLLASVRCARAALLISSLKSASRRSNSAAAALEEPWRIREAGRVVAEANLRVAQIEMARRRDFRLGQFVVVLLVALAFVIAALFVVVLTAPSPLSSDICGYY